MEHHGTILIFFHAFRY